MTYCHKLAEGCNLFFSTTFNLIGISAQYWTIR